MILFGEGEKSIVVLINYRLTYPNKTATKNVCHSTLNAIFVENNDMITPKP